MNMQVLDARRDVSGGYKVDVSRGSHNGRVSSEWFARPDDERFLSLNDLARSVRGRSERSRTRVVESALIHVEASRNDPERLALILPGAGAPVCARKGISMTIATLRKDTFLSTDFDRLNPVPADALLGLIGLYRADPRADKIDLGVGVFRDDAGATPVMQSVKDAEASLLKSQTTKSYLGAEGDAGYAALLADIVMGPDIASSPNLTGVQTPGGTGALRLGAELLARAFPDSTVWIGEPTWPNHGPIFMEAGLKTKGHSFYEVEKASIDFDAMMSELEAAHPGDILLLHGCCHNPTGVDFTSEQWARVTQLCIRKSLIPFIDLAYQGLGDGLEEDAKATRGILASLPTVLLAYSCDKNFGLYRERVGALWVQSPSAEMSELVRGNMLAIARSL